MRAASKIMMSVAVLAAAAVPAGAQTASGNRTWKTEDARTISWFGERPSFSPDGKRIVFIGKTHGDAFEMDLATGRTRNLTRDIPHQGLMRIQYLANGDYLVTAPRIYVPGESARGRGELWVLPKAGGGLMPLGVRVLEGAAVSRRNNMIAYAVPGRPPAGSRVPSVTFHTAEIAYDGGVAKLAARKTVLERLPSACDFAEPQDFRDGDRELIIGCYEMKAGWDKPNGTGIGAAVMGIDLASGEATSYYNVRDQYAEPEGIAPDGSWTTVECAPRSTTGKLAPLDICRLNLKPGAKLTKLVVGTAPGSTRKISNPVVSPDGKWLAYASGDTSYEYGSGDGILLLRLAE